VVQQSELKAPYFKKRLAKARTLYQHDNVDASLPLGALVQWADLEDLEMLPFVLLDVDLLGAFARAMILQAKYPSAKLVIGLVDMTMLSDDACVALSALRKSLGVQIVEGDNAKALAWGSVPVDAIRSSLLWSKRAETMTFRRWFSATEIDVRNTSSTSQSQHVQTNWPYLQEKLKNLKTSSVAILLDLWEIFGLDANREVTKQVAATLHAGSYALRGVERHCVLCIREQLNSEFEALLHMQSALEKRPSTSVSAATKPLETSLTNRSCIAAHQSFIQYEIEDESFPSHP
jgi:hypothetical protein